MLAHTKTTAIRTKFTVSLLLLWAKPIQSIAIKKGPEEAIAWSQDFAICGRLVRFLIRFQAPCAWRWNVYAVGASSPVEVESSGCDRRLGE